MGEQLGFGIGTTGSPCQPTPPPFAICKASGRSHGSDSLGFASCAGPKTNRNKERLQKWMFLLMSATTQGQQDTCPMEPQTHGDHRAHLPTFMWFPFRDAFESVRWLAVRLCGLGRWLATWAVTTNRIPAKEGSLVDKCACPSEAGRLKQQGAPLTTRRTPWQPNEGSLL